MVRFLPRTQRVYVALCLLGKFYGRCRDSNVRGGMWTEAARVYEYRQGKRSWGLFTLPVPVPVPVDLGVVGFGRISPSEEASSDELCGGQGACLGRETNFQTRAHRRLAVPLTVAVGSWCRCLRRG
jgi:hypothetical protein